MSLTKKNYIGTKEILATRKFEAIGVMVDATGIVANEDGRKIVNAGTVVGGKTNPVLINDSEVVVTKNTSVLGKDAEGVLLHDVDVSEGDAVGTMVIRGQIDLNKVEVPDATAIQALSSRILFIK